MLWPRFTQICDRSNAPRFVAKIVEPLPSNVRLRRLRIQSVRSIR